MLRVLFFYLLYVIFGTTIFIVYNKAWEQTIFQLPFLYGELLESISKTGEYKGYYHVNTNGVYLTFSAHRLPLITYFLYYSSRIFHTENMVYIAFIKNLFWQLPTAIGFYYFYTFSAIRRSWKLAATAFLLFFPQLTMYSFTVGLEEGYIIPAVTGFMGILLFNKNETTTKYLQLTAFLILLFWLKNTFLYIVPFMLLMLWVLSKNHKVALLGVVAYGISIYLLMSFNLKNAGEFTVRYPYKYWNLYKGNNPKTFDFYPKYTLDAMDYLAPELFPGEVKNQWEFDDFYKKKYDDYLKEQPSAVFLGYIKKFFVVTLDVRPNGKFLQKFRIQDLIGVPFMVVIRLLLWSSIFSMLWQLFKSHSLHLKLKMVTYLAFLGIYFAPYIIGWGTERHISPLFVPIVFGFLFMYESFFSTKKFIKQ